MKTQNSIKFDLSVLFNEPLDYQVIFYNDDITSFDFVISVLKCIYFKSYEESLEVALRVHNEGECLVDVYPKEIAEHKTNQTIKSARQHGYPLRVSVRPNSP